MVSGQTQSQMMKDTDSDPQPQTPVLLPTFSSAVGLSLTHSGLAAMKMILDGVWGWWLERMLVACRLIFTTYIEIPDRKPGRQ